MSNNYGPRIVTDGLVLCWDAADNNSYPGSGSTTYDLAGNNNGSFINSPSINDNYGKCFDFSGTNDRIECVNDINYGSSASWEAWAYRYSSVNVLNMFMGDHLPYFAMRSYGDVLFSTSIAGQQRSLVSSQSISSNIWYHFVFTIEYDGSTNTTMRIYINGSLDSSASYTGVQTNYAEYKFAIGDGRNTNWYQFNGQVALARIYNSKALSASEVLQNYQATKGRFGL